MSQLTRIVHRPRSVLRLANKISNHDYRLFVFQCLDLHVKRDINTLLQASAVLERRMVLRMSGRSRALHSFVNKNIIYKNIVAEKNPNIYL